MVAQKQEHKETLNPKGGRFQVAPPPTLPPAKEVKRVDRNLQKLFEQMERRRNFEG